MQATLSSRFVLLPNVLPFARSPFIITIAYLGDLVVFEAKDILLVDSFECTTFFFSFLFLFFFLFFFLFSFFSFSSPPLTLLYVRPVALQAHEVSSLRRRRGCD